MWVVGSALVPQQTRPVHRHHLIAAEHERVDTVRKDSRKRIVADVEAARVRAERRQDHARAVEREAPAPHIAAAAGDFCARMQVTGDLACGACRFVPQDERADTHLLARRAAKRLRGRAIMIALHPHPIDARDERLQGAAFLRVHPTWAAAVVKRIAEGDDNLGAVTRNQR